ncbi:hypothetical protein ACH5RR_021246 [Cinchona calisaya]|uniref:S-protein homolog n=1 Tax=Cinchona calisaya TaxID=153742 RepID=A0ABD2ZKK1_9GENT
MLCDCGKVQVHIMNMQRSGGRINVHCQSKDDDLGFHVVEYGDEYSWSFGANIWGSTLFYCDVQMINGDLTWYHFDAYDGIRDFFRCWWHCRWMIFQNTQYLFGYDEGTGGKINIRCQSKDDDLGYHIVKDGDVYSWSFGANIWGSTLFYCDVQMIIDDITW